VKDGGARVGRASPQTQEGADERAVRAAAALAARP